MPALTQLSGQTERVLAVALVVVLGGVLAALFWLGRDLPVDYDCGETEPAGNDLDGFRRGAPFAHALAALILLGAIVYLSWRRNVRRGLDRPGQPTIIAASVAALLIVVAVFSEEFGVLVIAVSLITSGLMYGLVVGAICLLVGASTSDRVGYWLTMVGLWQAVLGGVPFHALLVYLQGNGPILC